MGEVRPNRFRVGEVTNDFSISGMQSALAEAGIPMKKTYSDIGIMQKLSTRVENGETIVNCSPAVKVEICTNTAFCRGRRVLGENITEHRAAVFKIDKYLRAEVTDAEGRVGYTNFVVVDREIDNK